MEVGRERFLSTDRRDGKTGQLQAQAAWRSTRRLTDSLVDVTDDAAFAASWRTTAWREEATSWLDSRLAEAGLERTGNVTQPHLEPWSTVLSADTNEGLVWLKAMIPGTAFEIDLYDLLVRVDPEHVLHPIASDRSRGWLLLPDGGPSLADRLTGDELVAAMVVALPQYASIQRALTTHEGVLIEMGLTDLRPERLPDLYRLKLESFDCEPFAGRLAAIEPDYRAWCDIVTESPLSPTLDHNDLHPWNILGLDTPTDRAGRDVAVFYDWGDSVVAHPLGSAHVPISRVRRMVGLTSGHPDVLRMRDAYLDVFTDLATRRQLVELFDASCRLAKATRAAVWDGSAGDISRYFRDLSEGFDGM